MRSNESSVLAGITADVNFPGSRGSCRLRSLFRIDGRIGGDFFFRRRLRRGFCRWQGPCADPYRNPDSQDNR